MALGNLRAPGARLYGAVPRGFGSAQSAIPLPTADVPFTIGARSSWVAEVQSILAAAGFDPGEIDGAVGPRTLRALESALAALASSPSPEARREVANSGDSAMDLAFTLRMGFQYDRQVRGGTTPRPIEPETTIRMGPADAANAEAGYLGRRPPWGWIAGGMLALAGIGFGIAMARR